MPRKSPGEALQGARTGKVLSDTATTGKTPLKASKAPYRLKAPRPLESSEQAAVFQHAALRARDDPRWGMLFAIPNGKAASSIREAVNAKRTGLKRGVPDMFLPVPAGDWHGLFVELKRMNGRPSDVSVEQAEWLRRLREQGYRTILAFGWQEAVYEIRKYLGEAE